MKPDATEDVLDFMLKKGIAGIKDIVGQYYDGLITLQEAWCKITIIVNLEMVPMGE